MSGYWYHAGTVEQLAHRDGIEAALSHTGARDAGGDRDGEFADAIPFPDTAWRGLFGDYLALVRGTTEAAPALHFAAFAAYFGLALGRTVWCAAPQTHVNVSALLLGPSGDSRKSTTLGLAENTFALLSDPPVTMYGVASAEAIYRRLATAPETRVLVFADEFRALVAAGHRQATGISFRASTAYRAVLLGIHSTVRRSATPSRSSGRLSAYSRRRRSAGLRVLSMTGWSRAAPSTAS